MTRFYVRPLGLFVQWNSKNWITNKRLFKKWLIEVLILLRSTITKGQLLHICQVVGQLSNITDLITETIHIHIQQSI